MSALVVLVSVVLGLSLYGLAAFSCAGATARARFDNTVRRGPVPGYAYYPGEAVDRVAIGVDGISLGVHSLETYHSRDRQRIVLTLSPGTEALKHAGLVLERLVAALLMRSGAHVAVVELSSNPAGPSLIGDWTVIGSIDGRGWSGRGQGVVMVRGLPPLTQQEE